MNYTNRMVSSDNMGYASYLLENDKNPGELPGKVEDSFTIFNQYVDPPFKDNLSFHLLSLWTKLRQLKQMKNSLFDFTDDVRFCMQLN